MDRDNPWIALPKVWIRALRRQSMDCPALARSTDCATRLSAHVSSRVRLEVVMVDRKAFEEYITNSFEKKKGSKVISREKGKERGLPRDYQRFKMYAMGVGIFKYSSEEVLLYRTCI